jgi:hypothetical protein
MSNDKISPEISNLIKTDVVNLVKLKIKDKEAKKTAKLLVLNLIIKKLEETEISDELTFPELLKTFEVLEKADVFEDQTILENTIGAYLESSPMIQNNVGNGSNTLSGNINNLAISEDKLKEIPKEEYNAIKDILERSKSYQDIEVEARVEEDEEH